MADTQTLAPNRKTRRAAASATRPLNRARGEASIVIRDRVYKLLLNMEAMAEIEDGLGIDGLHEVEAALAKAGTRQMALILAALINAGEGLQGKDRIEPETLRRSPISMGQFTAAITAAFAGAGAVSEDDAGKP